MATGSITKVSNDSASGYCKMPDGTLVCWGNASVTTSTSASGATYPYLGYTSVTFTIPFYGEYPQVFANIRQSPAYWAAGASDISTTGFTVYVGGNTNGTTNNVCWLAIGRWK